MKGIARRVFGASGALVLLSLGVHGVLLWYSAKNWPVADGVVTSTSIVHKRHTGRERAHPVVKYEYTVAGEEYESSSLTLGGWYTESDNASAVLIRYFVGKPIVVRHAPNKPQRSYLEIGRIGGYWILIGFGLGCAALALPAKTPRRRT